MKILNNIDGIAGGIIYTPSQIKEGISFQATFDQPIIGYTKTLVGWEWDYEAFSQYNADGNKTYYDFATAIYDISPIYA